MRDIYDVLTALEGKAAELVASKSPEERDLSGMRDAVEQMESALAAGDLQAWAAADELFHARFIALTGNDRLVAMVNQLWDQAHRARMATLRLRPPPEQSNIEHRALVDSIARGDRPRPARSRGASPPRQGAAGQHPGGHRRLSRLKQPKAREEA